MSIGEPLYLSNKNLRARDQGARSKCTVILQQASISPPKFLSFCISTLVSATKVWYSSNRLAAVLPGLYLATEKYNTAVQRRQACRWAISLSSPGFELSPEFVAYLDINGGG